MTKTLDKLFSCDQLPWAENILQRIHKLPFKTGDQVVSSDGKWTGILRAVLNLPWESKETAIVELPEVTLSHFVPIAMN